jgi:hypothetical protein
MPVPLAPGKAGANGITEGNHHELWPHSFLGTTVVRGLDHAAQAGHAYLFPVTFQSPITGVQSIWA